MRHFLIIVFFLGAINLSAQVSNTGMVNVYDSAAKGKITVGAYVDVYYGFDFNRPIESDRLYCVSSPRHNEVNINLVYADFKYINDNVRAHFVPGFGNYINSNYAAEKGSLKNIVEANAGVKLFKKKDIWLDAGVLPSPYTNESAISKDHLMYTRSFAPEYVPYFLTGVKLSTPINKKVNAYWYLLNGWQSIQDANKQLSLGTQIEYRPNNKLLLNWNTYVGNESSKTTPDFGVRYFTDLYAIYNPDGKFSLTSCVYAGLQERKDSLGQKSQGEWWQANVIGRYSFNKKSSLSARIEYFEDASSIQIKPLTGVIGFSTFSGGLCYTLKISPNALFRFEGRTYFSQKDVYESPNKKAIPYSNLLITNLTVWF